MARRSFHPDGPFLPRGCPRAGAAAAGALRVGGAEDKHGAVGHHGFACLSLLLLLRLLRPFLLLFDLGLLQRAGFAVGLVADCKKSGETFRNLAACERGALCFPVGMGRGGRERATVRGLARRPADIGVSATSLSSQPYPDFTWYTNYSRHVSLGNQMVVSVVELTKFLSKLWVLCMFPLTEFSHQHLRAVCIVIPIYRWENRSSGKPSFDLKLTQTVWVSEPKSDFLLTKLPRGGRF